MSREKSRKPKKTKRGITHRIRRLKQKKRTEVEELIELAKEPVPPGTGEESYGRGPYCYVKQCTRDLDSWRAFYFRSRADAERARAAAITVDAIAEGRLDQLEELLSSRFFIAD